MAGSIADFNKRIAETKTRLAAEKKSSSGSSSKDVVVDPKTGRTWGSVEEYVTDPRKYGGGGGSSGRSFKEEFARRQASKAAEQVAAQKAVELKAQQQAAAEQQKESIQQRIIIKASGGVKVGDIRYVGNAIVPDTGGLTANQYRRKIRQQAIEEGIIDQKDYGKATLTITKTEQSVAESPTKKAEMKPSGVLMPYTPPTLQEVENSMMYEKLYSPGFISGNKYYQNVKENVGDIFQGFGRLFGKKTTTEQEVLTPVLVESSTGPGATGTYRQRTDIELSEQGLVYKNIQITDFVDQIKLEGEIKAERRRILGNISPDGITAAEADTANTQLSTFTDLKIAEYETVRKTKVETIQAQAFKTKRPYEFKAREYTTKILPDWKFDPYSTQESLYKKGVPVRFIKQITTAGSFASGLYEGVRLEPLKVAKTAGIAVGISVATGGLGSYAAGIYGAAKVARVASVVGKGTKGLYAVYGVGVGARVLTAGGLYSGAKELGRITSTEIAPLYGGMKFGAYTVRRVQGYYQVRSYAKQLPEQQRIEFYKTLKEAKSLRGISPEVKEIELSRLKLLEGNPAAQKAVVNYLKSKNIIVGGSVAQQAQIKGVATKRPGDIDIYIKTLLGGEAKQLRVGQQTARDLARILRQHKVVSATAQKGKVLIGGEKFLESHPYITYLRPNIEQVTPFYRSAYGSGITRTPSGIKVLRVDIQAPRKVIGYYLEPVISGKTRLKDLPAYESIKKSLLGTQSEIGTYPQFGSFGIYSVDVSKGFYQEIISIIKSSSATSTSPQSLYTPSRLVNTGSSNVRGTFSIGGSGGSYGYTPSTSYSGIPFVSASKNYTSSKPSPSFTYTPIKTMTPSQVVYTPSSYAPAKTTPTQYKPTKAIASSSYLPTKQNVFAYKPVKTTLPAPPYLPTKTLPPYTPTRQPTAFGFKIKPIKLPKSYKKFNVLGRRFGKFKVVGTAKTEGQAFQLGKSWSSKTLGATFKVPKAKWRKLPGYKTKTTKKGDILYIEPEKRRLKKRGRSKEIPEIQFYKSIKRGKKK